MDSFDCPYSEHQRLMSRIRTGILDINVCIPDISVHVPGITVPIPDINLIEIWLSSRWTVETVHILEVNFWTWTVEKNDVRNKDNDVQNMDNDVLDLDSDIWNMNSDVQKTSKILMMSRTSTFHSPYYGHQHFVCSELNYCMSTSGAMPSRFFAVFDVLR